MRYAFVGIATLIVYMAVGNTLIQFGISINWMAIISFTAAIAFSYILQKTWVFQDSRPAFKSLPKFLVMTLIGYVINSYVLNELIPQLPIPVAQLIAASAVVISNALFSFCWIFAIHSKDSI